MTASPHDELTPPPVLRRRRRSRWRLVAYPLYLAVIIIAFLVAMKLLVPPETLRVLKETYLNASPEGVLEATGDAQGG